MTDDPDELRYEIEAEKKDPIRQIAAMREAIDEIEIHLRYGLPSLKLIWLSPRCLARSISHYNSTFTVCFAILVADHCLYLSVAYQYEPAIDS